MKKLVLILASAMLCTSVAAQDYQKNILSVRAGVNVSNIHVSGGGESANIGSRIGYHVGVSDQILITRSLPLYIETGLYASSRGAKGHGETINPLYLQVPVLVNYHIALGEQFSIQPFAGVYYGLGIAGKIKDEDGKENLFGEKSGFKRSDFGIRVGVGFEWKRYYLGAGYEIGMMDLQKSEVKDFTEAKARANSLTISVGYKF